MLARRLSPGSGSGWGWIVALPIVAMGAINLASDWGRTFEDAWIRFRYARNLAEGHGLVSYAGGPADEGYSDFLCVLLQAAGFRADADPELFIKLIGLACYLALVPALYLLWLPTSAARRGPERFVAASLIGLGIAASTGQAVWATSGFETPVYELLAVLLAAVSIRAGVHGRAGHWGLMALLGFLLLNTRPEGLPATGLAFGVAAYGAWVRGVPRRQAVHGMALGAVVFGGLLLGLLAWKESYFGDVRPNPYLVKTAIVQWCDRLDYLGRYVSSVGWGAVAVAGGAWLVALGTAIRPVWIGIARHRPHGDVHVVTAACLAVFASGHLFFAWYSGGESSRFLRYLAPAHPFLLATVVWAAGHLGTGGGRARRVALRALVVLFAMAGFDGEFVDRELGKPKSVASRAYTMATDRLRPMVEPEGRRFATSEMGFIPYHVDAPVLDIMGLNQREIARTHRHYPVGEAVYAARDFVLAQSPDVIVTHGYWCGAGGQIEFAPATGWCYAPYFESALYHRMYDFERDLPASRPERWSLTFAYRKTDWRPAAIIAPTAPASLAQLAYGWDVEDGEIAAGAIARLVLPAGTQAFAIEGDATRPGLVVSVRLNRFSVGDREVAARTLPAIGAFTVEAGVPRELRDGSMLLVSLWTTEARGGPAEGGGLWRLGRATAEVGH
ncbi:MAG: hypothetical protein AAF628_12025 [Planctomycetota bacterium]